ncbi:Dynein light chain DLC [Fasciolopsis buskii]|uniref:Dynein light chain n=1 Tax=Fasciolopsis buskii TaxID=27845 RepID=A0A8E0VIH1_9TREM|nr:Dynein light chain DLC [Fasciolopsis buski]
MDPQKVTIRKSDMSEEMRTFAVKTFVEAVEKGKSEKELCSYVKTAFDKTYLPTWHCVVGRDFASHVTFDEQSYLHFQYGAFTVLLFKCG